MARPHSVALATLLLAATTLCASGAFASSEPWQVESVTVLSQHAGKRHVETSRVDVSLFELQDAPLHGAPGVLHHFNGTRDSVALSRELFADDLGDFAAIDCRQSGDSSASSVRFYPYTNTSVDHLVARPGFLLPQFHPHNQTSIARFLHALHDGANDDYSGLRFALVLGASLTRPDGRVVDAVHMDPQHLHSCQVSFLPASEQRSWPVVSLTDANGRKLFGCHKLHNHRFGGSATSRTNHSSGVVVDRNVFFDVAPEMPEHVRDHLRCGERPRYLRDTPSGVVGANSDDADDDAEERISLIQVHMYAKVVNAALEEATKPIMKQLTANIEEHELHMSASEVSATLNERVPRHVLEIVTEPLKRNFTNMMVDVATFELVKVLKDSLTNSLGPYIEENLVEVVVPLLHKDLDPILEPAVSDDLIRILPQLLERSLRLILTPGLTSSITHALVPTLTQTLQHTHRKQHHYCVYCYFYDKFCQRCAESNQARYYNHYTATYYSDYYTHFYNLYYTDAMLKMDAIRDPKSHPNIDTEK
eukprot:TRINITY_DN29347_c0_g1_i1.p1 TRINITY_DN29347_c0_g1~~TRINITY_DN29347_c0_g1_i1.p1  ORF type:complete len:542 (+),score=220.98 TRINITY_DN29347_c0_g1_i1:26-1627(+)